MAIRNLYQPDVNAILAKRYDLGGDYWTTPDRRLNKGSPFTVLECAYMLRELGVDPTDPLLKETADLIFGIGTLFMQVAYPFSSYNLFFYVYVLSFYNKAKKDPRFLEALRVLESKLADGKIVVERPNQKLASFAFCKKGETSDLATERYREILNNLV